MCIRDRTLLDVLDYMEKIPMVTAYKLTDGTTTTRFPMGEALDLSLIHIWGVPCSAPGAVPPASPGAA